MIKGAIDLFDHGSPEMTNALLQALGYGLQVVITQLDTIIEQGTTTVITVDDTLDATACILRGEHIPTAEHSEGRCPAVLIPQGDPWAQAGPVTDEPA